MNERRKNFRLTREMIAAFCIGSAIAGCIMGALFMLFGSAQAAEYQAPPTIQVPSWFWPALVSGLVQGLLVFGGVKVKLDWLFQRIETVEKTQRDDAKAIHARIDRALERRRASDLPLD